MPPTNDCSEPNDELRDALAPASPVINRPSSWWSSPQIIDVVNATREIIAWAEDKREFSAKHKPAWRSVINDYFFARNIPTAVSCGHIPAFSALDSAMRDLSDNLPATGDGAPIGPEVLESAITAARNVINEMQKPLSLSAAFAALLEVNKSSAATGAQVSADRDFFWRLVDLQGLNYRDVSEALLGILDDDQYQVQKAQFQLGDRRERPTAKYYEETPAGLSEEAKLDLCRRKLIATTPESIHAVWLAYQHAHLEGVTMRVGPVVFYAGQFIKGIANCESIPEHQVARLPKELLADRDRFSRNLVDGNDDGDIVYVRVDLGSGRFSDSVRVARQVAQSVVTLASFTASTGHWQLCDGFLQVVNDSLSWTGAFHRPSETIPTDATLDPTPVALSKLSQKLDRNFSHSVMATEEWTSLLDLLAWRERAKESDPTARIVLDVRVIETISGWIGQGSWRTYLDRYHKIGWIRNEIGISIANVGHAAANSYWKVDGDNRQQLRDIRRRFTIEKGYGRTETNIETISTLLDELIDFCPTGTRIRRDVIMLRSDLSSISNLQKWCSILSQHWDLTLDRAQRIRNSLAHGGPVNDEAALSVSQFVRKLSGWSVWISMESTMAAGDISEAHESWRQADEDWKRRVDTSSSARNALFSN